MAQDQPWSMIDDGLALIVRLTPRGGRDALDGVERLADGRAVLKARVRAAPENGNANGALLTLIARSADIPVSRVTIMSGAASRVKTLHCRGEPGGIERALRVALDRRPRGGRSS